MGEVGEGGTWEEEGGQGPLSEPTLEGYVPGVVADGGGGEGGGFGPGFWEAGGGGEEGGEFAWGEAAIVVGVMEEKEIDKEAVAGGGELDGRGGGDVEFGG